MIDRKDHDEEKFLLRWSRLKRGDEVLPRDESEPSPRETSDAGPGYLPQTVAQGGADLLAFDPSTLPPIESISAASDIRAFLAPGVPEELKRAALRRAWITDPAIRDFVGLAENQWDFNKPDGIPGFGSLELTLELCRIVASLFSDSRAETTPSRLAKTEPREQAHVHEKSAEPASSAIAPASDERDPQAGRPPAPDEEVHADPVELAMTEHLREGTLQRIPPEQKTSRPK
jgi:hypothetical protein